MQNDNCLTIIEPSASGHRMIYVRRIAKEAVQQGIKTIIATDKSSLDHPAYKALMAEVGKAVEVQVIPEDSISHYLHKRSLIHKQLGYYRRFKQYYRSISVPQKQGSILIPYLDHCDKAIAILGSPFKMTAWSGICMQYKFHHSKMGIVRNPEKGDRVKERLYFNLLDNRTLRTLFTIDETLLAYTLQKRPELSSKVQYLADPVDMDGNESQEQSRASLGLPQDKRIILVYGLITKRKNIEILLETMDHPNFPGDIILLIAGKQDREVQNILSSELAMKLFNSGKIVSIDRFLNDDEEYRVFRAADFAWVAYRDFYGMSGVLIQACKMELSIIACRSGLIGWMVKKYNVGTLVNEDNSDDILLYFTKEAIHETCQLINSNSINLSMQHSSKNFATNIVRYL